jgi:O-antigen ligase
VAKPEARPRREAPPKRETPAAPPPPAIVWALRLAFALAVLLTIPLLVEQYEAPKIWAVRAAGLGVLMALPFAFRLRALRTPIDLAVLAAVVVEVITTLASESRRVSVLGEPLQREGLITSLALAGMYFAARAAHPAGRGLRQTLRWFWIPAAIAAGYALIQVAGLDPVPYAKAARYGAGILRPFGTLGHANLLGVAMAAAACIAAGEALRVPERRPFWIVLAGLFMAAVLTTLSRGAWLGAGAGLLVTVMVTRILGLAAPLTRRDWTIAGATLVAIVAGVAAAGWGQLFTQRAAEFGAAGAGSAGSRLEIWRSAIAAFQASPAVGHGPDTFDLIFTRFQTPAYWTKEWGMHPFHAHSIYLHQLATRGIFGGLTGLALVVLVARAIRRLMAADSRRDPAQAEAHEMLPIVSGMLVAIAVCGLFGAIGITGALLAVTAAAWLAAALDLGPVTRKAGLAAGLVLGVAAAAVIAVAAVELTASHDIARSRTFIHVDPRRAVTYAEQAARLWPHEDQTWRALSEATLAIGMAEQSLEYLDRSERTIHQAIQLVPRPLNYQKLAEVLSVMAVTGDEEAARAMRETYLETFRLMPRDVIVRSQAARAEIGVQAYRRAIGMAAEATRLDPTYAPAWLAIARSLERLGQDDSALVVLDRAMRANWRDEINRRDYAISLYQQIQSKRDSSAGP